jgi:hypothetical protein
MPTALREWRNTLRHKYYSTRIFTLQGGKLPTNRQSFSLIRSSTDPPHADNTTKSALLSCRQGMYQMRDDAMFATEHEALKMRPVLSGLSRLSMAIRKNVSVFVRFCPL